MSKHTIVGFTCFFIMTLSFSAFAENLTQPETFILVNSWLTSEPQPGADHHVLSVCMDEAMTEDCTQCIYQASGDGAVHIPMYNRCVFRTYQWSSFGVQGEQDFQTYNLFWQVKAVSADGFDSEWTLPNRVHIQNHITNKIDHCSAALSVRYDF